MGQGVNVGNLIATLGLETDDFNKGVKKANESMDNLKGGLGQLAGYMSTVLANPVLLAVAAFTALAAAAVEVGKAALEAAKQFEEASNTIRIGTGATGDALNELNDVVKNINGTMAASTGDISTAIADLNTAYGLQGDELEGLSKQYLALAQVTGMDVSKAIEKSRAVFNKFGVSVEDQTDKLDFFFRVSQNSGVKMDQLLSVLDSADRGFQLLGLTVEESAALIGNTIQKDGVEAAQELAQGLEMAAGRAVEMWGSESEAQAGLKETLKLMQQAGDEQAATKIGSELFGTRYAGKVAGAVQGGALNFDELFQKSQSGDNLQDLAKETETLDQKMQKLGATSQEALLPIGNIINDSLKKAVEGLIPVVEGFGKVLEFIVGWFEMLWRHSPVSIIIRIWETVTQNKQVQDAIKRITDAFDKLWGTINDGVGDVDLFAGLIEAVATIIIDFVVPALTLLADVITFLVDLWLAAANTWKSLTEDLVTNVTNLFGDMFDGLDEMLYGWIEAVIEGWGFMVTTIVSTIAGAVAGAIDMWDGWLNSMLDAVEDWGQAVVNFFVDWWNNMIKMFQDGINALLENSGLKDLLGFFGVDVSVNLSDWQITAPEVQIARSDVLKDAAGAVRGAGSVINQTVNITTSKVVDALEAQRGIERANRDIVRSGV